MTETVLVRPRRGLILDGIPRRGAAIPAELADDWIANQLVERIEPPAPVVGPKAPVRRRTTRRTAAKKRRSTK